MLVDVLIVSTICSKTYFKNNSRILRMKHRLYYTTLITHSLKQYRLYVYVYTRGKWRKQKQVYTLLDSR
jgi:hypothetical protein